MQAQGHAGQVEVLAQAVDQVAHIRIGKFLGAAGKQHEGGRARLGLGDVAQAVAPAADNQAAVEVADGATPVAVMDSLNLPRQHCHLVLVNGVYVEPGKRESLALKENDVLAIWPPVAGG